MKKTARNLASAIAAAFLAATAMFPGVSHAQGTTNAGPVNNSVTTMDGRQAQQDITEKYLRQELGDPKEEAAYQAFHKVSEGDGDKKIHLGIAFLTKYPSDRYAESVYEELSQAYYDRKDLPSFYTYSEKGISLFPDDVHLLALSGWIIPRAFDPHEPDADKKLDKAELYEKHALVVMDKMQKPAGLPDDQFNQFKTGELAVAHSGLGFVYFRREQYDASAKELITATQNEATPDPTDYFILGADLENLSRYKEAADAFNRCAQTTGSMQGRCKKYAGDATQRAADAK
jgi:tetratricopeptide (TPR) repeat protein